MHVLSRRAVQQILIPPALPRLPSYPSRIRVESAARVHSDAIHGSPLSPLDATRIRRPAARHGLGPTRSRTRGWPDTIARATRATWSWRGGGCSESDHLPRLNVSCQHAQQLPPVVHHHPYRRLEGVLDRGQGLSRRRRRDSLIFNKGVVMSRPKASSRRPEADVPALDCSLLGIRFVTKLLEHWIW